MEKDLLNPLFSTAVRVIPPKNQGNRGFFPSSKVSNGVVNYESQIERDFYLLLDHADDVINFQHQPITIHYNSIKGKLKYTPDVYVEFSNGIKLLVEIKDEETYQNKKELFKERWEACKAWAKQKNITFILLTDIDIRSARLSNIWFTLGSGKVHQNNRYIKELIALLAANGSDYNSLVTVFAEEIGVSINKSSQIISYAIYHGIVFVDTFSIEPIRRNTIIRRKKQLNKTPFRPLWVELDEMLENRDENHDFNINEPSLRSLKTEMVFKDDLKIDRRELIVKEFLKTPSFKRNIEWRTNFEKKYDVSKATIYRWVKRYEERGIEGLNKNHSKSGKKKKWDYQALQYLEKARLFYLKPNISYKKAYDDKSLDKFNHSLTKIWDHEKLDIPSISTFIRYIRDNTSYFEKEELKKGRKHVRSLKPSLNSFQGAIMPMQVLQFDNTVFDVFLASDKFKQSIGTPNLCAAIDCYTRMITGFELTLNSINRQSVLETLVQSISSKDNFIDQIFTDAELVTTWDIEGFPVLMLIDNGMDYRSDDVKKFCLEFDIILEFAPIRTPRYKAYIENWFSTIKYGVNNELAGEGFRPSVTKRMINPELKPERGAIFTLQELEKWVTSWILDEYHFVNPYNDGLPAPYLRYDSFQRGEHGIILPLPREPPSKQSNKEKLVRYSLMSTFRKFKSEIEWENLKFSSPEMIEIWKKIGKQEKVELRYNFRDIRTIWLKSPIDDRPIRLNLVSGWADVITEIHQNSPISLTAWRKEISEIRKYNKSRLTPFVYRKEKGRIYREQLKEVAKQQKITKKQMRKLEIQKENKMKLRNKSDVFDEYIIFDEKDHITDDPSYTTTSFEEAKKHMPAFWDYEDDEE